MSRARPDRHVTNWLGSAEHDSAQHLAAIVENSDDAIVSKELDGKILSWNDAATRMYGYTAEEALNQPIDIVIAEDPERRQEELDIRARIARGERIEHYETIRRRKDGTHVEVSLSISPVRDATGRKIAAAGFARDISERRHLEDERRRANGLLARFADFSAHDFKTPMQHILWDAQSAEELLGDEAPGDVKDLLDRIIASSRWMQRRADGLQAASGLTGGRSSSLRARVSAERAFDESHRMLAAVDQFVRDASITRDNLPKVASNEVLLGFLFQNLLQNACKYVQVGVPVEVHVSAERVTDGWQFSIQDNGRGVPPDKLDSIFEPYVRAGNVGSDEPGSGIGLSFCHAIVEWHRGHIWAESGKEFGEEFGSKFSFTIPDIQVGK
jgi:PAS domain S-box-containing protein